MLLIILHQHNILIVPFKTNKFWASHRKNFGIYYVGNLVIPPHHRGGGIETWFFCAGLHISFNSYQNIIFLVLDPTSIGWLVGNIISVQICTFHEIHNKKVILAHYPPSPSPMEVGRRDMIFLCTPAHFIQYLAKKMFGSLTLTIILSLFIGALQSPLYGEFVKHPNISVGIKD